MPTLTVKPAPLAKKSVIVMSWPYTANWDTLTSLSNGCYLQCSSPAAHQIETILLFSLVKMLEYKLTGTAIDAVRGKFCSISADVQKNHAILTLTTEPTFSAVRKVLTVVSKNFAPSKLMPLFKKYAQEMDIKADPAHFNYAVAEMAKGLKSLSVFVTGTIRLPDDGLKALKSALDNVNPELSGKGVKPPAPKQGDEGYTEVKVDEFAMGDKLDTFLCQQMLKTIQTESHVRNGNLVPITGSSKWDTVKAKVDKDRISRFVELKLLKLGDKLPGTIRLMCASSGYFTSPELAKLPESYTSASLTAILKKHF